MENEFSRAYMPKAITVEWGTPQKLFDELNAEFHFTLDPCATDENHKCEKYYTEADDGLSKSWDGETVFCNPPYGHGLEKWVSKAYHTHTHNRHAAAGPDRHTVVP